MWTISRGGSGSRRRENQRQMPNSAEEQREREHARAG